MQLQNLMDSFNCYTSILKQIPTIISQSGHNAFQFGQYQSCLQQSHFNYNLVWLGQGDQNLGIYMGACLPDTCTPTIIQDSFQNIFKMLKLPLNIFRVDAEIQNYQFPQTFIFFFTVCLLAIMALIVLIATFTKAKESKYLIAFSLQQTFKVFQYKQGSDLNVFNGIRSLAMMWVVIGHTFINVPGNGITNIFNLPEIFKKPFFLVIQAGMLSVDVFFFLGGFFLAFVFFRQKSKSWLKYPIAILQRVLRIWPAYIVTILFYYQVFMHLGSGPRWPINQPMVNFCSTMWRPIFFVDNLVDNGQNICLAWGWYLQVDFQIFLVCLLLLSIYSYKKMVSLIIANLLIIGSWVLNLAFTEQHQQKLPTDLVALNAFQQYFTDVYIKPYGRWAPYILGLYVGIGYHQYCSYRKDPQKNHSTLSQKLANLKQLLQVKRYVRRIIEWSGLAIILFVIFIPHGLQVGNIWPQAWHSIYLVFSRFIFPIGIILMILPTLLGIKDSFFRTILDTKLFNFLAKISFCVYLVHYIVLSQIISYKTYDIYYFIEDLLVQFVGVLVLSCFFGFLLTVIVELPCSMLQKQFFKVITSRKAKQPKSSLIQSQQVSSSAIHGTNNADCYQNNRANE